MTNKGYGAVVARFQCSELTPAHIRLLKTVYELHGKIIIVLGVPRTPLNATNPLSFEARQAMVAAACKGNYFHNYTIVRQQDERRDDVWSTKLDTVLDAVSGGKVTLYTGRDGFSKHYVGRFPLKELDLKMELVSATEKRAEIVENPQFDLAIFRSGIIYAMNTKHFQTYNTVDMAMFHNNGKTTELLLCRKPNETEWRFPGGFIDEEKNETFAQAAAREMQEETGLVSEVGWTIVKDYPIPNEWRLRKNKGVSHRTILLYGYSLTKNAKAMDDIAEVKWFDLDYVVQNAETLVVSEHRQLMINDVFKAISVGVLIPQPANHANTDAHPE